MEYNIYNTIFDQKRVLVIKQTYKDIPKINLKKYLSNKTLIAYHLFNLNLYKDWKNQEE